jgi:hypothetical protein
VSKSEWGRGKRWRERKGRRIQCKGESKGEEKNRAMREGVRVAFGRGFERATEERSRTIGRKVVGKGE